MGQIRGNGKEGKKGAGEGAPQGPPAREDLEVAAYFHWLGRGCPPDDAMTDWIEVEKKWGTDPARQ